MKIKQIRKFIALFDYLPLAGEILSAKSLPEQNSTSKISAALQTVREIRNDPDNSFMVSLFDEINHNLYHLPDSRLEPYIEDILRGFTNVSPFLYYPLGMPWPETTDEQADTPQDGLSPECRATLQLLSGLSKDTDVDDESFSDAAKYVFSCYAVLLFFSKTFDSRCLLFKLNLYEIQDRLGIYILYDRDYNELINAGYWDKVLEEVIKDETPVKALTERAARESLKIKPFSEWLNHKNPEKLASICRYVFDVRHSPKDYAIMLCLLHQYGYINLDEKHRIDFYDSWFAYIGKSFPKNHNYYAINRYIDTYGGGFHMVDDDKPYYQNKQELFDWKLKTSRL